MPGVSQIPGGARFQAATALQELANQHQMEMVPGHAAKSAEFLATVKADLANPASALHKLGAEAVTDALVNLRFDPTAVATALGGGAHGADLSRGMQQPTAAPTLVGQVEVHGGPPAMDQNTLSSSLLLLDAHPPQPIVLQGVAAQPPLQQGVVTQPATAEHLETRQQPEPAVKKAVQLEPGKSAERFKQAGKLVATHAHNKQAVFRDLETVKQVAQGMIAKGAQVKPLLDRVATTAAESCGGRVAMAPVKSEARTIAKAINDYDSNPTRTKDIARNTVIVPTGSEEQAMGLLRSMSRLEIPTSDIKRISAEGPGADPCGYSGMSVLFPTEFGKGEIQINSPVMIFGKESAAKAILGEAEFNRIASMPGMPEPGRGHALYEEYRKWPPHSPQAAAAAVASRQYYAKVRDAYAQATRPSAH